MFRVFYLHPETLLQAGKLLQLIRSAFGQHCTIAHEPYHIATFCLFHDMSGDYYRLATFRQFPEVPPEGLLGHRVNSYRWFVQQEQIRAIDQGTGKRYPLVHPSAKHTRNPVPGLG